MQALRDANAAEADVEQRSLNMEHSDVEVHAAHAPSRPATLLADDGLDLAIGGTGKQPFPLQSVFKCACSTKRHLACSARYRMFRQGLGVEGHLIVRASERGELLTLCGMLRPNKSTTKQPIKILMDMNRS